MPLAFYVLICGFVWLGLIVLWMILDEQNRMAARQVRKPQRVEHRMPQQDPRPGSGEDRAPGAAA